MSDAWIRRSAGGLEELGAQTLAGRRSPRGIARRRVRHHCVLDDQAETTESSMSIAEVKKKDISNLLRAVPKLVKLPTRRMWIDYDDAADVLYLSFQRPQRATDSEMRDDGVILHRRGSRIVGITVLDASSR